MPLWVQLVFAAALGALAIVALLVCFLARRLLILRSGVCFELSANRDTGQSAAGWVPGVGVYGETEMLWYRTFSLALRPKYRFERGTVTLEGRRQPTAGELATLTPDVVIVETHSATPVRQFALGEKDLTTLLSWLESSPPGLDVDNVL